MICERCSKQCYLVEQCSYCKKKICEFCKKSAKRVKKANRYVICKDCWGDIKKRQAFKEL